MSDEELLSLEDALEELSSAEDFLQYFNIPYEPSIVHVNRLHIMQRYHDYLDDSAAAMENYQGNEEAMKAAYKALLERAYQDFVDSDALTEKVFKVFKMQEQQNGFVSVESLLEG